MTLRRRVRSLRLAGMLALAGGTLAGGTLVAAPSQAAESQAAAQAVDPCPYSGATAAKLPATAFNATTVVLGLAKLQVTGVLTVPATCTALLGDWSVTWGQGITFSKAVPTTTFDPKLLTPGPSDAKLTVKWTDALLGEDTPFTAKLLKRTTFGNSFNAIGEPLVANDPLYLTATLGVADWKTGKYLPYQGRSVRVQWKAVSGTYLNFGFEKTDKKGRIKAYWTSEESGTWRLAYGGNSLAAPAVSNGDFVQVL